MSFKAWMTVIGITTYLVYLLGSLWGVGKLAKDVEGETWKLKCRAECRLYKAGRRFKLKKECKKLCDMKKL